MSELISICLDWFSPTDIHICLVVQVQGWPHAANIVFRWVLLDLVIFAFGPWPGLHWGAATKTKCHSHNDSLVKPQHPGRHTHYGTCASFTISCVTVASPDSFKLVCRSFSTSFRHRGTATIVPSTLQLDMFSCYAGVWDTECTNTHRRNRAGHSRDQLWQGNRGTYYDASRDTTQFCGKPKYCHCLGRQARYQRK